MFRKKLLIVISIIIVLSMVFSLSAFAKNPNSYINNGNNNKLKAGKQGRFLINEGIIKGNGNGEYFWKDYVKRGDIVVMIVRAFKLGMIYGGNFPDVEEDSYYYEAICTAKSLGIAKGDGKKFNPKKYVTLEEAIALIERSVKVANRNVVVDTTADLYKKYIGKIPKGYATRDQIADMLYYILTGDITEDENYELESIVYSINEDTGIKFSKKKFVDVFEDKKDEENEDEDLDYVKFGKPSSGKLYYNYDPNSEENESVTTSKKYFADPGESRDLSKITFVPSADFTGIVSIEYTAYDEDGNPYTGVIEITVLETDGDLDIIKFKTKEDTSLKIDEDEFIDVLDEKFDEDLNYVKFVLPSQTNGRLYYDYDPAASSKITVKADTIYFVDPAAGMKDLSKITFIPYPNYVGTFTIDYSAVDKDGKSYEGKIEITVLGALQKIEYSIVKNTEIKFDEDDFADAIDDVSDKGLHYVKFTLPSESAGKLYYEYKSSSDPGTAVSVTTKYYFDPNDGRDLSKVSFVPVKNYIGEAVVQYEAFDKSLTLFKGTVEIIVEED